MKPIDLARAQYDKNSPRSFEEDVAFYVNEGWVYSGQEAFIMGRPICTRDIDFALDYKFKYKVETWDCWFVYLAAGKGIVRFFNIAPFALPKIAWHRRDKDKANIYEWSKFYDKSWNLIDKENYNGKH
tara:strand:- start:1649 stop:2032 length:384 start_codon:yes stop_codon:yes gene_type:complete